MFGLSRRTFIKDRDDVLVDFVRGIYAHLSGPQKWADARNYYVLASKHFFTQCNRYRSWIDNSEHIEIDFDMKNYDDAQLACAYFEYIRNNRHIFQNPAFLRALELVSELAGILQVPSSQYWYRIRILADCFLDGISDADIKKSIQRVGPIYNKLNSTGIPLPREITVPKHIRQSGWRFVDGFRFIDGNPEFRGTETDLPLITFDDCDVALWLAFLEGEEPISPSFSLDDAKNYPTRLNVKTFGPDWLCETDFGQSMFWADLIMKSHTMRDGIPSLLDPLQSSGMMDVKIQTDLMEKVGNLQTSRMSDDIGGRLEIVCSCSHVMSSIYKSKSGKMIFEYSNLGTDIIIDRSNYVEKNGVRNKIADQKEIGTTQAADIIENNYCELGKDFPVFERVEQLLGMFGMLSQARRDGVQLSQNERNRLQNKIGEFKTRCSGKKEYVPKAFHKGGCYCNGGVYGSPNAYCTDFVVSINGFTTPVPNGASGPTDPKHGTGMVYSGGSGGHGFNSRTTAVQIMDENSNQGPRSYYKNSSNQKVDPFTGRTVGYDEPWAHIYHNK